MGKKYKSPPIIESVCEFRLPPDTKWDLTIPGLIFEKVKEQFPHREPRVFQEVELKKGPQGVEQLTRSRERILFLTNDRNIFIQVGHRLFAINCLKPYPTWNRYKPKIEIAFKALTDTIEVKNLQRIGLRYINRIEIPEVSVKLDDYFEFRPFLGSRLPKDMKNFIVGCVLPFAHMEAECNLQLTAAVPEKHGSHAFILDLDYFPVQSQVIQSFEALNWVEKAHTHIEEIFEGCITAHLRKIFQEVK